MVEPPIHQPTGKGHLYLAGGFNNLEKSESQWEGLSRILWKIKNV